MSHPDINKICYGCVKDIESPGIVCPHCGWDNSVRSDEWGRLPATTLRNNRFFIGRPLGSGGFGVTYLGRDLMAGEFEDSRRAIKEFFPMGMAIRKSDGISVSPAGAEMVETYEKRRQRSYREGQRMAEVGAQVRNVVRAYDCFPENGTTYIVMEYIDGDTLTRIVREKGAMNWRDAYACLKPVLAALKKMHSMSIYHMDISPDNIMLRKAGPGGEREPVILDFGASIESGASDVTRSKSSMTVRDGFTPPEQYTASFSEMTEENSGAACMDEYAICATMYYAITGEIPMSSTARLTGGKLRPISSFNKAVPEYIENIINKGMSLRVADRYASIGELMDAFESPPRPWIKFIAIGAVLVILALGILLILRPWSDGSITLDADGQFTWKQTDKALSAALVGSSDDREIRYTLESGQTVRLTGKLLKDYDWTLEETQANGAVRAIAIRAGKNFGVVDGEG